MTTYKPGFRKRLALNLFSKYADAQATLHKLSYLFWECTLRCNINCIHCGSDCSKDASVKDMPSDDFLNVTKQISQRFNPNKIMVVITGGEPLMRKDLEYCGKELYKQGFPWGFVTNGFALTEERLYELLNSGLRSMTISLDGLEETHNWMRGNDRSFEKAINAIKLVSQKDNDIVFDVVTCVNQRNIVELPEIKNTLISLDVKKWRIFSISPIGRAKDIPELNLTSTQFCQVLDFIAANRKEKIIDTNYGCEGFLGKYEAEVRDNFFFCRAGINIASILADGSICACPNIDRKHFTQGNIYTDNFLEIWQHNFQNMRDRSWAKTGTCVNCKEFKWCRGNGLHLRDVDTNDVLRCHYNIIKKG